MSNKLKKSIGWQPAPKEFPVAGLHSFEVYENLEMGKSCHPEVNEWIEVFDGMIEKPVMIPYDGKNKNIEILQHNISYFFYDDDTEIEVGDCEYEHIVYMISQDYWCGELSKPDPNDDENTIWGWWKIEK